MSIDNGRIKYTRCVTKSKLIGCVSVRGGKLTFKENEYFTCHEMWKGGKPFDDVSWSFNRVYSEPMTDEHQNECDDTECTTCPHII